MVYASHLSPKHLQHALKPEAYLTFEDRRRAAQRDITDLMIELSDYRDIAAQRLQYENSFYLTSRWGLTHDGSHLVALFVAGRPGEI